MNGMRGHVLELTMHMYGCRNVQKAVQYGTDEHKQMVRVLF